MCLLRKKKYRLFAQPNRSPISHPLPICPSQGSAREGPPATASSLLFGKRSAAHGEVLQHRQLGCAAEGTAGLDGLAGYSRALSKVGATSENDQ